MESYVWNEMSFRRYMNRKNELELDFYELPIIETNEDIYYGLYENIYEKNTFSVEDLFDFYE